MMNSIRVLLCSLILVVSSKADSISNNLTELSGKVAERQDHAPYSPLAVLLDSVAFLMYGIRADPDSPSTYVANAVVVTEIHAITSFTSIKDDLEDTSKFLILKVGVFVTKGEGTDHIIHHIEPHPKFQNHEDYPYADIAVIFLQDAIKFPSETVSVAQLALEDLDSETKAVIRLCNVAVSGKDNSRGFYPNVHCEKTWIFSANPAIYNEPMYASTSAFWLIYLAGIAPSYTITRPRYLFFTKIYNFLPFIIDQLRKDHAERRDPPYDFNAWIKETDIPQEVRCAAFDTVLE